ncbi:MAG TPA: aldolase/citrate lyase family protein [Geminicoccus sp.]|jgi:2-keto-3-deoxy-L-rhamnonate aldolase RhmA|uniref:HpcH/HpaI aldolase family protein n=1 Tax=Geminicoccus sp. TaxID=2024832 RepID=UPI002E30F5A6|nr:aldolase/citrate lyase family protein [Geminicoccus sp.]HEX2528431.1 aldolase/citrate lyase family protein [Geminicoccus sp.]
MDAATALRAKLNGGGHAFGTMAFEFFTPGLTALLHHAGCDFVILDTEHSGAGIDTIKQQIAYARGLGIAVWARPAAKTYAHVATLLDAGADGIMAPMLETPEEARDLVEWSRYRPEGKRGCAFGFAQEAYRGMSALDAQKAANERITLIGLIETKKGLANAEAILATPGMDVGWMGHFDMSDDFGIPGRFEDPIMQKAFDDLAQAAKNTGKAAGTADADMNFLKAQATRGYRCHGYGNDVAALRMAMSRGIADLKAMVA